MCGLNIAHKLLPGKENKSCSAGVIEYIFYEDIFFFPTACPDILNVPQCDETKCGFSSGTKALKTFCDLCFKVL